MKKYLLIIIFIIFTISVCFGKIIPNGGENYYKSTNNGFLTISWDNSDFDGNINIYLWNKLLSKMELLVSNFNSDLLSYDWLIPYSIINGNHYRIKIEAVSNPSNFLMSGTFFSIYLQNDNNNNNILYLEDGIRLFPMPVKNYLSIVSEKQNMQKVNLVDLNGKLIFNFIRPAQSFVIDMRTLANGKYLLVIQTESNAVITKIITLCN